MSNYFFIGIGGAGMSGAARLLRAHGHEVSGYDRDLLSLPVKHLLERDFIISDKEELPPEVEVVVRTAAVPMTAPLVKIATERGLPIMQYKEVLGEIAYGKTTIAVCGTHGKTTTTAMLAKIFIEAEYDPTVLVGSEVSFLDGNVRMGKGEYFIVEADEFNRNFEFLQPDTVVVTNLEADHLDYYKDLDEITDAFAALCKSARQVVLDPTIGLVGAKQLLGKIDESKVTSFASFRDVLPALRVPGQHNRANAAAALVASALYQVPHSVGTTALADFPGTARRLEYKGKTIAGAVVIDDYAHHPTEIQATVQALRERWPKKNLVMVFEPHLISRTIEQMTRFQTAFDGVDKLFLLDAYRARENYADEQLQVTMTTLVEGIKTAGVDVERVNNYQAAEHYVEQYSEATVIVIAGAGPVTTIASNLTQNNRVQ